MYVAGRIADIDPTDFNGSLMVKVEEPKPVEKKEETVSILGNLETLGIVNSGDANSIEEEQKSDAY